jgi:hypothetical protein
MSKDKEYVPKKRYTFGLDDALMELFKEHCDINGHHQGKRIEMMVREYLKKETAWLK